MPSVLCPGCPSCTALGLTRHVVWLDECGTSAQLALDLLLDGLPADHPGHDQDRPGGLSDRPGDRRDGDRQGHPGRP